MFDESVSSIGSSNNTNETCFSIGKINSNISQIRYKDPAIYWTDNTKIYTNIVRAIVTILDNSSLGSETLYIYYPIDIVCLQNNSYASKVIPIINNDFDEVVYSNDGANPEYDNSNTFESINNLYNDTTESYVYAWSVIDHIFEKDNDIKNQLREKVNNFFE